MWAPRACSVQNIGGHDPSPEIFQRRACVMRSVPFIRMRGREINCGSRACVPSSERRACAEDWKTVSASSIQASGCHLRSVGSAACGTWNRGNAGQTDRS